MGIVVQRSDRVDRPISFLGYSTTLIGDILYRIQHERQEKSISMMIMLIEVS